MKDNVQFSFIMYVSDLNRAKNTWNSIEKQDTSDVQMIILSDSGSEIQSQIKEVFNDTCFSFYEIQDGISVNDVKSMVCGKYVFFTKEGVRYREGTLDLIRNGMKNGAEVLLLSMLSDRCNMVMDEYELYCQQYKHGINLTQNHQLVHCMYFAYGLKQESMDWTIETPSSEWDTVVLKLVLKNVLKSPDLYYIPKSYVWVESFNHAMKDWEKFLFTEEGLRYFYNTFYLELKKIIYNNSKKSTAENGRYVLLYYTNRLCLAIQRLVFTGKPRPEEVFKGVETTFVELKGSEELIAANPYISVNNKQYILTTYFDCSNKNENSMIYHATNVKYRLVYLNILEIHNNTLHMEVSFATMLGEKQNLYCRNGNKVYECDHSIYMRNNEFCGIETGKYYVYFIDIPLSGGTNKISFFSKQQGEEVPYADIRPTRYSPLSELVFLYKHQNKRVTYFEKDNGCIVIKKYDPFTGLVLKCRHIASLCRAGKPGMKAILARTLYHLKKLTNHKKIWLFSDRTNRADDNGEVMFEYVTKYVKENIEPWFVIDENTEDYERMKQFGKVVAPFSARHKLLFLLNEVSLSSQANRPVMNPFGGYEFLYRDLIYDKKLVFLQHGITKDNQSKWLNKYNRNLFGLVVTTRPEYDSMFEYDYFYDTDHIWLTGMPRYDRLYHDEKNYITIMPTWRKSLSPGTNEKGVWLIGEDFTKSRYFKFYNELLNHKRLLEEADRLGYQICYMPHPNTVAGLKYFVKNSKVEFFDMKKSYRDVFAQTDLMITDYSSVAFDFAYLRKPLIYSQFDKESFFNGDHSYTEGYFDYERDGFGEVTYDLESTVDSIIGYMQNGCVLKPEYRERIDKTFAFHDQDCCKRVYDRVLELL